MPKDKENLQGALSRLEQIIQELGQKDVDVEAGLEKFKEGVQLIKFARSKLQKAENEFQELKKELEEEFGSDDVIEKENSK